VPAARSGAVLQLTTRPRRRGWRRQHLRDGRCPPQGASLTRLPFATPAGAVIWYPGSANPRTAYLLAHLSNGTTRRLVPAVVGGRKYFVLAAPEGVKLTRLTLYDIHRHLLADITSLPRVK
jgi:hypothetical protein